MVKVLLLEQTNNEKGPKKRYRTSSSVGWVFRFKTEIKKACLFLLVMKVDFPFFLMLAS